jgi:hypothetical protein
LSLIVSALIVAAAVVWAGWRIVEAIATLRADATLDRALRLLETFAPAMVAVDRDPRALLVWQPLARSARSLCAREFTLLDRAAAQPFPFSAEQVQAAHDRWTAEWLAWERTHDATYKLKAAAIEQELAVSGSPLARAQLDAVEREKLELYQHRYEEYVKSAKALRALIG